ncbi:hypothetical protein ED733_003511 [Metarhizium rileyi]|uniref:Cytochrome P450 n=1 Tax=Metarhizium rileyi (strain RCEF 4871) TaxID=1649241 RepID=A0A5C6GDE9_METRR|nr:hypothetical protein ED733_003511 [Metarhizium rileyi]
MEGYADETVVGTENEAAKLRSLSTLSLVITLLFLCAWPINVRYRRLRNVPGPIHLKLSRFFLSLYDYSHNRNDQILKWHRQYGPIVCVAPNEVSVASLEATKVIYGTTHRWAKSNYFDSFKGFHRRSVFATKPYEEHRAKRRLISTFYQASSIYTAPDIEKHVQERSEAVLKQVRPGEALDFYSLSDWYGLDIITFLVLGPDQSSHSIEQACQEREIMMELKRLQFASVLQARYPKLFALVARVLGQLSSHMSYLSADKKLTSWCQQRISTAMKGPDLLSSHSLLRHLLQSHVRGSASDEPLDHQYIAAEILDNINAAEATVAVTATYLVWRLTLNPQWQKKIREELAVLPVQNHGSISFADINSRVPSLEACLREVYRLHPASSGRAERVVPDGGYVLSGCHLPEGTVVAASVLALHRDESVFPDPDYFCPERWLETDEETRNTRESRLIPFGYGGRICLGKALATMEIKVLMARLYLNYETFTTPQSNEGSMKQCSTHDAVPLGLECMIRFQRVRD